MSSVSAFPTSPSHTGRRTAKCLLGLVRESDRYARTAQPLSLQAVVVALQGMIRDGTLQGRHGSAAPARPRPAIGVPCAPSAQPSLILGTLGQLVDRTGPGHFLKGHNGRLRPRPADRHVAVCTRLFA